MIRYKLHEVVTTLRNPSTMLVAHREIWSPIKKRIIDHCWLKVCMDLFTFKSKGELGVMSLFLFTG
jgi:hypothetical protein